MKIAVSLAVIGIAWAAAVYVHQRHVTTRHATLTLCNTNVTGDFNLSLPACESFGGTLVSGPRSQGVDTYARIVSISVKHPAWEDPVAVLLVVGGLAAAAAIVQPYHRTLRP
jgi:hypothetical protein